MRKIINDNIGCSFSVEYSTNIYDEQFWDKVEIGSYEPDTLFTLKRLIDSNTIFFDVGAAEGCMSLISASLGAQVIAYEPFRKHFDALSKNVSINPEISNNIKLNKAIVANFFGETQIEMARGKLLSSINYSDNDSELQKESIPILNLSDEILKFSKNNKIVIKIDIEGGEYSLLRDLRLLNLLNNKKANLILAIHPGFFKEIKKSIKLVMILRKIIFLLRNYADNYLLFKRLSKFATVYRSNDVKVNSAVKFAIMAGVGVYEYNITFNK